MKRISKILALLLALAMVFSVLVGCADDSDPDSGDTAAETGSSDDDSATSNTGDATSGSDGSGTTADHSLTIGVTSANTTHDLNASVMRTQVRMIYEALFQEDPETGEIVGKLAESYEYLDDTTIRIHLRDDIYFTDGQQMTTEDVLYSYQNVWAAGMRSSYFVCYDWENTSIIDDFTIEFKFNQVYGPVASYMIEWGIVCAADYIGDNPADADK